MLTDAEAKRAKPGEKPYKLYDSGGLFLLVSSASKLWRMKYQIGGKEKLLSFGPYPEVTISAARDARDAARAELRAGRDPSLTRKVLRANAADTNRTFEKVARAWHEMNAPRWKSRQHAGDVIGSLEKGVFSDLGNVDVREITPAMVLSVLRKIERRPAVETAKRVRQRMSAVFEYAIASGLTDKDPAAVVSSALVPLQKGHQPAVTDLDGARKILQAVADVPAHPGTKLAIFLLALTAVRPGEIVGAAWDEFVLDAEQPYWLISAERMKMKRAHVVPLAPEALAVIEAVRPLTGRMPFLFPNVRQAHKPMSANAMGYLLNRAGYHGRHVPHGWRSTFSTIMNERYPKDRATIDLMLAHVRGGKHDEKISASEAIYNRSEHIGRRRELALIWAKLLMDGAPDPSALVGGRKR